MDKKKIFKIAIILAIVIAVVALIFFVVNWFKNAPIRLVENYIKAAEKGDGDKLDEMFDLVGWYAWNECDEDADDFHDEYKDSTEDDAEDKIKDWGYTDKKDYLESALYGDDNVSYKIAKEPTLKKIGKDLYKVKVKLKINDDGYKFDETWQFVVYKNKIIAMGDLD